MHHTEHATTIEAPVDVVYDVLADVEGYARLFPPTQAVELIEESDGVQIARLTVDVSGQVQSWVTRRDLDPERHLIAYRQLETAPLVEHMGGEWRAFALDSRRTQLVITHDFAGRSDEADAKLGAAVERNSHADLAAVKSEAERRPATVG